MRVCFPGCDGVCQSNSQKRHALSLLSPSNFVSRHVAPPSVLSSTLVISASHAHAPPRTHTLLLAGTISSFRRTRNLRFDLYLGSALQFSNAIALLPIRVVKRLIIPRKRTVGDDDALEPFDRRHRIPTGHDGANWKAMLGRQVVTIHFVSQQHIATRFLQRDATRERQFASRTLWVLKHAAVGSFQNHFARIWFGTRSIEQGRKSHAGPLGGAYRTEVPLHALYFQLEETSVVPCAFQSHRSRD